MSQEAFHRGKQVLSHTLAPVNGCSINYCHQTVQLPWPPRGGLAVCVCKHSRASIPGRAEASEIAEGSQWAQPIISCCRGHATWAVCGCVLLKCGLLRNSRQQEVDTNKAKGGKTQTEAENRDVHRGQDKKKKPHVFVNNIMIDWPNWSCIKVAFTSSFWHCTKLWYKSNIRWIMV